jgi:hypothetical protein
VCCTVVASEIFFPRVLHLWSADSIVLAVCSLVVATGLGTTKVGTTAAYALWRRQLEGGVANNGYFADGVLLTLLEFFLGAVIFFIGVWFCASRFQHLRVLPAVFFSRRSRWPLPYQGHPGGYLQWTQMVPKRWKFRLCAGHTECISGLHADPELMLQLCSIYTLFPKCRQRSHMRTPTIFRAALEYFTEFLQDLFCT